MTKPSLDSIASAKAKLAEELRKLEEQEVQLLQEQAADAFAEVASLVSQYGKSFSSKQRAELVTMLGADVPKRGLRRRRKWHPSIGFPTPARLGPVGAGPLVLSLPGKGPPLTQLGRLPIPTRSSPRFPDKSSKQGQPGAPAVSSWETTGSSNWALALGPA